MTFLADSLAFFVELTEARDYVVGALKFNSTYEPIHKDLQHKLNVGQHPAGTAYWKYCSVCDITHAAIDEQLHLSMTLTPAKLQGYTVLRSALAIEVWLDTTGTGASLRHDIGSLPLTIHESTSNLLSSSGTIVLLPKPYTFEVNAERSE